MTTGQHPARCRCDGCKVERVHREAATYRKRLRVSEKNTRQLLDWYVGTMLIDASLFDSLIGLDAVTLPDGAIDFTDLLRRLQRLIEERPYLAR